MLQKILQVKIQTRVTIRSKLLNKTRRMLMPSSSNIMKETIVMILKRSSSQ